MHTAETGENAHKSPSPTPKSLSKCFFFLVPISSVVIFIIINYLKEVKYVLVFLKVECKYVLKYSFENLSVPEIIHNIKAENHQTLSLKNQ